MSNAAEMDAQEIINYIATAPKKTPVKLYVREKPGMKVAWGDAHVYGGRRGKTVFGDWDELKTILDANADSIDYYDVENDCRNSAVPMLDLKGINARIEPGAIIRDRVEIGDRAVIMMGAIINIGSVIGEGSMIDMGAKFAWLFTYMPIGAAAVPELIATAEQRKFMYEQIHKFRETKPIFTMDFWNDGDAVGGCIAGGRGYCHINANGDVEPCAFIH